MNDIGYPDYHQYSRNNIGDKIAESVVNYFLKPEHRMIINRLKESGLQFAMLEEEGAGGHRRGALRPVWLL